MDSGQFFQQLRLKFPEEAFIRIEPKFLLPATSYQLPAKSVNIQPGKTLIINLTKSEEQLLSEMHPKTRYNIKLAQKHGVEIKDEFEISIGNGLFTKEAVELIVGTGKRQGYKGYGRGYYEKMINFFTFLPSRPDFAEASSGVADLNNERLAHHGPFRDDGGRDPSNIIDLADKGFLDLDALARNDKSIKLHIYKAIFHNQLLASAIMLDFGKIRTFLFGGSSDENKNVMAPYLMHWQAMVDAKAAGLLQYDF